MKLLLEKCLMENYAEKVKDGQMVALYIPIELGKLLKKTFDDVPGDAVAPRDMHITIGLVDDNRKKLISQLLRKVSKELPPFDVELSNFDTFSPNEHNEQHWVLVGKPKSDTFKHVHKKVFDEFHRHGISIDNGAFDFNPHITIKYCPEKPVLDKNIKHTFRVEDIYFTSHNRKKKYKLNDKNARH